MTKRTNNDLEKYLAEIKRKYNTDITDENYVDLILEELKRPPSILDYIKNYVKTNNEVVDLEWGCLMFLFIRADQEKHVSNIEKYYELLRKYPANWFTEVSIAELQLTYYGDLFKALEKFHTGLKLKPGDAHCHYTLGLIYHLLGVPNKSVEHYENAALHYENSNFPHDLKARSLYNIAVYEINIKEDYEKGEKLLKEALKEMPDYPEAKTALRQIWGRGIF
jgi:tetratricopeptide (TPR) repeat protein